ncbi:MAG: carbohydrate ABC transporter permease [Sphaerochaetaceae bacterium]
MRIANTATAEPALLKRRKFNALPYLLLVPTMFFLVAFTFYPFINCIRLTFYSTDSIGRPGAFIGLRIWKKVLASDEFKRSISNTLRYAGCIGVGTFSLAMVMAFLCTKSVRGSKVYQTMFALPMALATAPIAAIATYIFSKYGIFNGIVGSNTVWLSGSTMFPVVVMIVIWANSGSSFIYLLVGFRNVPDELLECADLDGANPFTKFFHIYLPIASPQVFFVIFLNILSAFKSFAMIKILVGTDDSELAVLILKLYSYAFVRERYETGCVYALVLSLVIFLVSRIQFLFEKKAVFYQ